MTRIVVLGDLNLDVYATHPSGLPAGAEARSVVRTVPGGSAGTFARVAAAAGASVTFLGCVGNDLVGDLLVRSLEDRGIVARVARDERPTGTIVSLEHAGERTMLCSRGANDGLTADRVDEATLTRADHLHVSGYAFLSDMQRTAASRAIGLARERGLPVSVDPPPANLIRAFGVRRFLACLDDVTWLFPNASEGRVLSGFEQPAEIADALADAFPIGAVTLGPFGALAWDGARRSLERTPEKPGNPTGAGDAYAAAFVVGFHQGLTLTEVNLRACRTAADWIAQNP